MKINLENTHASAEVSKNNKKNKDIKSDGFEKMLQIEEKPNKKTEGKKEILISTSEREHILNRLKSLMDGKGKINLEKDKIVLGIEIPKDMRKRNELRETPILHSFDRTNKVAELKIDEKNIKINGKEIDGNEKKLRQIDFREAKNIEVTGKEMKGIQTEDIKINEKKIRQIENKDSKINPQMFPENITDEKLIKKEEKIIVLINKIKNDQTIPESIKEKLIEKVESKNDMDKIIETLKKSINRYDNPENILEIKENKDIIRFDSKMEFKEWVTKLKTELRYMVDFRVENENKIKLNLNSEDGYIRLTIEKINNEIIINSDTSDSLKKRVDEILNDIRVEMRDRNIEVKLDNDKEKEQKEKQESDRKSKKEEDDRSGSNTRDEERRRDEQRNDEQNAGK